ncbi:MAG: copper resistance protein CopC [Bacillota bacterium]|nr:copper resistance protein CopC [Bacillota bacterium]
MFRYKKIFLSLFLLLITFFTYPSFSSAHATVVKSNPAENQLLVNSPDQVSVEFDEPIQSSFFSIEVYDTYGNQKNRDDGYIDSSNPKLLVSDLKGKLSNGVYTIKWRAVSSDGHPVNGLIPFQIGTEKSPTLLKSKVQGYLPHFDSIFLRWIQYISGAIFVGLTFFYLTVLPRELLQNTPLMSRYKKIINISFVLFWISILLGLPLEATIEAGVSWQGALHLSILKDLLSHTLFGTMWFIEVIMLVLLLFTVKRNNHLFLWWSSFILGACLLFTKAITGHANTSKDLLVSIEFDFLHLFSASIWIGSLIAMVILLPMHHKEESKDQYIKMVKKFSTWGKLCVFALVFSGIYMSAQYVPTIHSLFSTNYGRVLIGKITLFAIMLLFAFMNNRKGRNDGGNWRFTLWGEITTGLFILILAVLLTNLPTAYYSLGPINQLKSFGNHDRVQLKVSPNIAGENTFEVVLKDKQGHPLTQVQQVTLTLDYQQMDMGSDTIILPKVKDGRYKTQGLYFTMSGQWKAHIHVLTKSEDSLDTDFTCIVGR